MVAPVGMAGEKAVVEQEQEGEGKEAEVEQEKAKVEQEGEECFNFFENKDPSPFNFFANKDPSLPTDNFLSKKTEANMVKYILEKMTEVK
jgi:hypothetical protein